MRAIEIWIRIDTYCILEDDLGSARVLCPCQHHYRNEGKYEVYQVGIP